MKTILIADDEEVILDALGKSLRPHFKVICFTNPKELIQSMNSDHQNPDLIILDIDYKVGISGTDGVKLIRKKWPEQRIVLMSATTYGSSISSFIEENNAQFLEKPFSNETLFNLLGQMELL